MPRPLHRRHVLSGIGAVGAAAACARRTPIETADAASPLLPGAGTVMPPRTELEPAWLRDIDGLWSWFWAGEDDEHLTVDLSLGRGRIMRMEDLSGNGNHLERGHPVSTTFPAHDVGVARSGDWGTYATPFTPLWRHLFNDGGNTTGQWLDQERAMVTDGPFYFVAALLDTRSHGTRDMWGRQRHNCFRYDQNLGRIRALIDYPTPVVGSGTALCPRHSFGRGPLLIDFGRDADNRMQMWANGRSVGFPDLYIPGTLDVRGFGSAAEDPDSSGARFDDMAFELMSFTSLPDSEDRARIRAYLNAKWHLYET